MTMHSLPTSAALAALLLSSPAAADTILLTDGKSLADVTVVTETLAEVTYRPDGSSKIQTVPSDKVLRVDFARYPQLVDRGLSALVEDNFADAIDDLTLYVDGFLSGDKREKLAWAPAYAAWKLVEIRSTVADWPAAAAAADRMATAFPDARYVPMALLAKAQARKSQGDGAGARAALEALSRMVDEKGLSRRWRLECDLAGIVIDDSLTPTKRREKLAAIAGDAGAGFPSVKNRAKVAEGEALLEAKDYDEAEKIFQKIVDDPKADDATLAGAYTGLGDCLFQRGASLVQKGEDGASLLEKALMSYMRVVVVYKNQSRYVPKAMFYSGRAYQLVGTDEGKERAKKLYRETVRQYRGTPWADEARNFLR